VAAVEYFLSVGLLVNNEEIDMEVTIPLKIKALKTEIG